VKAVRVMLETLAKVLFEFAKVAFFRESFAKVGYFESLSLYALQLVNGYHLLPPGVRQENVTAP